MSDHPIVIHWFRRDLRLRDNPALLAAHQIGHPIAPVFIFDPHILRSPMSGTNRLAFMLANLHTLDAAIREHGGRLLIFHGEPHSVLAQLATLHTVSAITYNRDYTPTARKRDDAIAAQFADKMHAFNGNIILPPEAIQTGTGNPYTVYTPFKNKWREISAKRELQLDDAQSPQRYTFWQPNGHDTPIPTIEALGRTRPTFTLPDAGEHAAHHLLGDFMQRGISTYASGRNHLEINPFTATDTPSTSRLSPYFRMGILSPVRALAMARTAYRAAQSDDERESIDTWVNELIWREFYMHVGYAFPHVYSGNFRTQYDALQWEQDADALARWQQGETGYPIVDAAMRQLNTIGWMPNRARMVVASFLTKDLLINWREGERYFMQHLIDGDPAANNGGWQWAAGTGTDAQPYFRIFNPVSQSEKFDPNGTYIHAWIPELRHLTGKYIHAPWKAKTPPTDYPPPIVDHKTARQHTIEAFKATRDNN